MLNPSKIYNNKGKTSLIYNKARSKLKLIDYELVLKKYRILVPHQI